MQTGLSGRCPATCSRHEIVVHGSDETSDAQMRAAKTAATLADLRLANCNRPEAYRPLRTCLPVRVAPMSCEACARMQDSESPIAHAWLTERRSPTRLHRLGRPPVVVRHFRCSLCGTNWLSESDPLQSGNVEWLCLHYASNVIAPVSTLNPGSGYGSQTPCIEATRPSSMPVKVPPAPAREVNSKRGKPAVPGLGLRYSIDTFPWRKRD